MNLGSDPPRFEFVPDPDVRVEQELHRGHLIGARHFSKSWPLRVLVEPRAVISAAGSGLQSGVPFGFVTDRANNISHNHSGTDTRAEAAWRTQRSGRVNFSDGLAKARDLDGLAGFANLFEHSQTCGFEFGDGDVFHVIHLNQVWTIVRPLSIYSLSQWVTNTGPPSLNRSI